MFAGGFKTAYSGHYQQVDCNDLEEGLMTAEEAQCGDPSADGFTRDCNLKKVGPLIYQVGIAVPVSRETARSFAYGVVDAKTRGIWEKYQDQTFYSPSQCHSQSQDSDSQEQGMPPESMYGVLFISTFLICLALGL